MKKFLTKFTILLLFVGIIPCSFCYFVDPYNVFHPLEWIDKGIEPNKNYIKMSYILANPTKYTSFIFGSSRVGSFQPEFWTNEKVYNMTYSEGLPHEHLDNLKTFIKNNIIPKTIYIGVDSLSYMINPERHYTDGISAPYEMSISDPISFWSLYLDPAVCFKAATEVINNDKNDAEYAKLFYEYGWNTTLSGLTNNDLSDKEAIMGHDYCLDETLEDIRQIKELCDEYNIELVVFTNPMHKTTYLESLNYNYFLFLAKLADITPYYNFSSLNKYTTNDCYWMDTSHYIAEVAQVMYQIMCTDFTSSDLALDGFGILIDSSNIDSFLDLLKNQIN